MEGVEIPNFTRVLGVKQGYIGLHVLDFELEDGTRAMGTAWKPSPTELEALSNGALVYVLIIGEMHPPILVQVQKLVPDTDADQGSSQDHLPHSEG